MLQGSYTLPNGAAISKLGLGTWMIEDDVVAKAVKDSIDLGYRHIDTGQAYQNEPGVGEGVRTSGVAPEEIFVTTKLDASNKGYDGAQVAIDGSLGLMGLDCSDLMIIHSPPPWGHFSGDDRFFGGTLAAWTALEER
ncbi:aldo/keto reductase [Mesobacterium pallidum]|uniref:aldo/keto reductase n=1 Tax=Mesobacterium pallidum TaxID=2872037 RepID=UPI001EE26645|nr:aldo/keto reductase [Mesobacterium pallidum]